MKLLESEYDGNLIMVTPVVNGDEFLAMVIGENEEKDLVLMIDNEKWTKIVLPRQYYLNLLERS